LEKIISIVVWGGMFTGPMHMAATMLPISAKSKTKTTANFLAVTLTYNLCAELSLTDYTIDPIDLFVHMCLNGGCIDVTEKVRMEPFGEFKKTDDQSGVYR